jgi:tRNA pseudouridine38-40 synthase
MPNYKLTLAYDGTRYSGWQRQGNTPGTVQEKVERALSAILEQEVEIAGSGRTDAGAHARAQVASFRAHTRLLPHEILRALRDALPEDIGAVSLDTADPRFHARLSCRGKTYVYRLWNTDAPCVFERRYVLRDPRPLDMEKLRRAAAYLVGTHDFSAFNGNKQFKKSAVRTIFSIDIEEQGGEARFALTGDGFLYNMARIIVGTLLIVGRGEMQPEEMTGILASKDRRRAGPAVPAQGLILWEVFY